MVVGVWLNVGQSIFVCFIFSLIFVSSLYFRNCGLPRNHPQTVRIRLVNVAVACLLILVIFSFLISGDNRLAEWQHRGTRCPYRQRFAATLSLLGIRTWGFITACFLPLLLTMILFLGPLVVEAFEGLLRAYFSLEYWRHVGEILSTNILFVRNVVVSPLAEELVFRGCMVPVLAPHFSCLQIMFISPLMFGLCHAHHLIEKTKSGQRFRDALISCLFQITYTTVFGAYSVYLFLRTGHIIAPIIVHAFCNHMGFPEMYWLSTFQGQRRRATVIAFIGGFVLWLLLVGPLTTPSLYSNTLYTHCEDS